MIGKVGDFVSFHGVVHPVDFSSAEVQLLPTWTLLDAAQKAEGWLPGGWQAYWAHQGSGMLYVLMHQGGAWSHRQVGTQVWVYDVRKQRRVDTIVLTEPANSIVTTRTRIRCSSR